MDVRLAVLGDQILATEYGVDLDLFHRLGTQMEQPTNLTANNTLTQATLEVRSNTTKTTQHRQTTPFFVLFAAPIAHSPVKESPAGSLA